MEKKITHLPMREQLTNIQELKLTEQKPCNFELRQPYLIGRCLIAMNINDKININKTQAAKPLLNKDKEGDPIKFDWYYHQVIGILDYLTCTTQPDTAMATRQCATFCEILEALHKLGVRHIGQYFLGIKYSGIVFNSDKIKGLECCVDAAFDGGCQRADSENPENVLSRTVYTIMYANYPIVCISKLQIEIVLSTAESEYITLS